MRTQRNPAARALASAAGIVGIVDADAETRQEVAAGRGHAVASEWVDRDGQRRAPRGQRAELEGAGGSAE